MHQVKDCESTAQRIINAIPTPIVITDSDLKVVTANPSYCELFNVRQSEIIERPFGELNGGAWGIPGLQEYLKAATENRLIKAYEVESEFERLGRRTMHLNACDMSELSGGRKTVFITIMDVTSARKAKLDLRRIMQERILLDETSHRTANTLMIIAGILSWRARKTSNVETKSALEDAHKRILSAAVLQKKLKSPASTATVDIASYLSDLCGYLSDALIDVNRPKIGVVMQFDTCKVSADHATQVGSIVAELVMNTLKHAYPLEDDCGEIRITYQVCADGWRLTVCDDGINRNFQHKQGLGTSIVGAIARRLQADVEISIGDLSGYRTSITHRSGHTDGRPANSNRVLAESL